MFPWLMSVILQESDVVFIAVKPHLYQGMFSRLQDQGRRYGDKLWVSIMAGVVLTDLTAAVNSVTKSLAGRIVRHPR